MSTAGRTDGSPPTASDVAATLRQAEFVRFVAAPDGDAVAATGLLARALDCPFQANVAALDDDRSTDADLTVAVGREDATADLSLVDGSKPASALAFAAVEELGGDPDLALALAGVTASGHAGGPVAEAAEASGLQRRPGVAVPTDDLADGLAHATLIHGPFSGDVDAAADALADLEVSATPDDDQLRRVASLVAVETVGQPDATPSASDAIQRALRPHRGGPFETVEGYADVLACAARESPGVAVAEAVGHGDVREPLLSAWRTHARRAHAGLRTATTGRYDGLFVVRGDDGDLPVRTVARLARDFRSPEPVVLAVTEGRAAATATDGTDVGAPLRETATELDGAASTTGEYATMQFGTDTASVITTFREAL